MFSRWPIRRKLILGIALLLVAVMALAVSSFIGVYDYRGLAKNIRLRAPEFKNAAKLSSNVSKLSVAFELYRQQTRLRESRLSFDISPVDLMMRNEFKSELTSVRRSFDEYRQTLESNREDDHYGRIGDQADEQKTVGEFEATLANLEHWADNFGPTEEAMIYQVLPDLDRLSDDLPEHLHSRMKNFAYEIRGKYHFLIGLTLTVAFLSACLLALAFFMFMRWIFTPLQILVHGSRRVAAGDFGHRIHLRSQDEIAELAQAMNKMTHRFQEIRDDLDRQVQQRTKEVVRSEQMASVGFLAAGVAHEINNPLASIALCSESLEERLGDIIRADDEKPDGEHNEEVTVLRTYLRMIQDEAFRCKEITERLLDFSRLSDVEKHRTDLTELTRGVIEMVGHLGKYKQKAVELSTTEPVVAPVNPQEMKQVLLNLITNSLDSLDPGGRVELSLSKDAHHAVLVVKDNGCGMTDEVKRNIFEPFFTRRRDGQGTGLGMSITYRIITDHGGDIEVNSNGPGTGSCFTVTIPLRSHDQENRQQAA